MVILKSLRDDFAAEGVQPTESKPKLPQKLVLLDHLAQLLVLSVQNILRYVQNFERNIVSDALEQRLQVFDLAVDHPKLLKAFVFGDGVLYPHKPVIAEVVPVQYQHLQLLAVLQSLQEGYEALRLDSHVGEVQSPQSGVFQLP